MAQKQKDWRKVVKRRMKRATVEEAIARYRTEYPIYNYRWEHVTTVVKISRKLAKLTGADEEIVEAAAWLHDIVKQKAKYDHALEGAISARKILAKTDFPPKKIEAVVSAIKQHSGLYLNEPVDGLEAQVLWDADKLAKIGLTAAFHWMGAEFAREQMLTTKDLINIGQDVDWHEKTVASMHTKPAKQAAAKRLERYNKLWKNLAKELNAKDII